MGPATQLGHRQRERTPVAIVNSCWVSEDRLPRDWPLKERPDALLRNEAGDLVRAIEYGGDYPASRLTQPYAAPERIAKHASEDFRSDMFSLSTIAYEMLTLTIPYDGLGGQAGTPKLAAKTAGSYRNPSREIPSRGRLTKGAVRLLDGCVGRGLKLHPDERFATSTEWLAAWDELHLSLKKGSRLSRVEEVFLTGIDLLTRQLWWTRERMDDP